jgi:release factor glutamine methyltransferase
MDNHSDAPHASLSPFKRVLYRAIRGFSHRLNNRRRTTVSGAGGFRLVIPPTVFHPRYCLTGEFFAKFIARLDLAGKHVADLGTGSGILALAAARAGAASVVAIDINPNAAQAAAENARVNGFENRVRAMCSDLLTAIAPEPRFDVILSNMPVLPLEPADLIDRGWYAGRDYRDIASLYEQARERLTPEGRMYILMPSGADSKAIKGLFERAGFRGQPVHRRFHVFESLFIYELAVRTASLL